jgi:catechol 2,3-dioxygenase-like lactoylglutathione lyase family enzyme
MLNIVTLHHVTLPVSNLERAKAFYEDVLGLEPIERPKFSFFGAWYRVGSGGLHLIVPEKDDEPTFRPGKGADSHDAHFAIRVARYSEAVRHLESKGYRQSSEKQPRPTADNPLPMRLSPSGPAGFPQIYVLDPDRNVIEINAERLD